MPKEAMEIKEDSLLDLIEMANERPTQWGSWRLFNEPEFILVDEESGYEIPLEGINSSAQMLDWIYQFHGKAWMTPGSLHSLVSAMYDIFRPQENYCSDGVDKRADGSAFCRKYWDEAMRRRQDNNKGTIRKNV